MIKFFLTTFDELLDTVTFMFVSVNQEITRTKEICIDYTIGTCAKQVHWISN